MKMLAEKNMVILYKAMGDLSDEMLENDSKYKAIGFSVFDHWLSKAEAEEQIFFYEQALEENNAEKVKKYYEHHDRMLDFYLDLYNKTTVYGLTFSEYGPSAIVVFDSIEEYKSHVLLSVREQLFLKIILPEYTAVISGNYDLTHLLYTLKSKPESLSKLSEIIKQNGLFIL